MDGRTEQEDDEEKEEERNDQFQLIGNFSPINRTDGGRSRGGKVKLPN